MLSPQPEDRLHLTVLKPRLDIAMLFRTNFGWTNPIAAMTRSLSSANRPRSARGERASQYLESREMLAAIVVNTTAEFTTNPNLTTLPKALEIAAQTQGRDQISFGNGIAVGGQDFTDQTPDIILLSQPLSVETDVDIIGPGAALLALDGGGTHTVVTVNANLVVFRGMTMQRGYTTGRGATASVQGSANADFEYVIFRDSFANGPGGGISNDSGTVNINECTFRNLRAAEQGAGVLNLWGTANIKNSVFIDGAAGEEAAGVYNYTGYVSIANSTFTGHVADGDGGVFHARGGTNEITNVTMTNNRSNGGIGGAINVGGGASLTINKSVIVGNSDSLNRGVTASGSLKGAANVFGDASLPIIGSGNRFAVATSDVFDGVMPVENKGYHSTIPWGFKKTIAPTGDYFIQSVTDVFKSASAAVESAAAQLLRQASRLPVLNDSFNSVVISAISNDFSPLRSSSAKTASELIASLPTNKFTGSAVIPSSPSTSTYRVQYARAIPVSLTERLAGQLGGTAITFTDSTVSDSALVTAIVAFSVTFDQSGISFIEVLSNSQVKVSSRSFGGSFQGNTTDASTKVTGSLTGSIPSEVASLSLNVAAANAVAGISPSAMTTSTAGSSLVGWYAITSNLMDQLKATNNFSGIVSSNGLQIAASKFSNMPTDAEILSRSASALLDGVSSGITANIQFVNKAMSDFAIPMLASTMKDLIDTTGLQKLADGASGISRFVPAINVDFALMKESLKLVPGLSVQMKPGDVARWALGQHVDLVTYDLSTTLAEASVTKQVFQLTVGIPKLLGFEVTASLTAAASLNFRMSCGFDTAGTYLSNGSGFTASVGGAVGVRGSGTLFGVARATASGNVGIGATLFVGVLSNAPDGKNRGAIPKELMKNWGVVGEVKVAYTVYVKATLLRWKVWSETFHDEISLLRFTL